MCIFFWRMDLLDNLFVVHRKPLFFAQLLIFTSGNRSAEQTNIFVRTVLCDSCVFKAVFFVTSELPDCIIHQRFIEYSKADKKLEIVDCQTCNFTEQSRLQFYDNIFQGLFAVICQIHEDRNSGCKFNQLLLDLFTLCLELFFFL